MISDGCGFNWVSWAVDLMDKLSCMGCMGEQEIEER